MSRKIIRAYKYRLYPTKTQQKYLIEVFGCVRFVWNQLVANFNEYSSTGPNRPCNEKILKEQAGNEFLKETISYALQQKRIDFEETKKQFFSKTRKKKLGSMKFKKKGIARDSFRIPGQALGYNKCVNFDAGTIKIPKMTPMKIVVDRQFSGDVVSVTVSRNKANQYFVSILVNEEVECLQNTGRSVGIDLGLKDLLILSNGVKVLNPKWFRESQAKLAKAQKHLSRKTKGSARYEKQRLKVAKLHLKVARQREWFLHNLSTWLVRNYDIIVAENLNVAGMLKNRCLSKSIQDASWSTLVTMIKYKSEWYGRTFHQIDRWYPSSKTCGCCGAINASLQLQDREWVCSSCGTMLDRDLNAASNILEEGLKDLHNLTSAELADYVRGEAIRPDEDIHPLMAASMKRILP